MDYQLFTHDYVCFIVERKLYKRQRLPFQSQTSDVAPASELIDVRLALLFSLSPKKWCKHIAPCGICIELCYICSTSISYRALSNAMQNMLFFLALLSANQKKVTCIKKKKKQSINKPTIVILLTFPVQFTFDEESWAISKVYNSALIASQNWTFYQDFFYNRFIRNNKILLRAKRPFILNIMKTRLSRQKFIHSSISELIFFTRLFHSHALALLKRLGKQEISSFIQTLVDNILTWYKIKKAFVKKQAFFNDRAKVSISLV